jgi:hypothetical protein
MQLGHVDTQGNYISLFPASSPDGNPRRRLESPDDYYL